MDSLKPPEPLSLVGGNVSENWRRFKQRWDLYSRASGANEKPEAVQCAIFLHVIGDEAIEVYNTMTLTDEERDSLDAVIAGFEQYCNPRKNVSFERYKFGTRKQKEGETIDQFVTELKSLAASCEYEHLVDGLIRDQILLGTRDNALRARLLREHDLTLTKALELCRAHEASEAQLKSLTAGAAACSLSEVNEKKTSPGKGTKWTPTRNKGYRKQRPEKRTRKCDMCGYDEHDKLHCPARNKFCNKCNKKGHFASRCPQKNVHVVVAENTDCEEAISCERFFLGQIKTENNVVPPWRTDIEMNGTLVSFKIDCGADVNVISEKTFKTLDIRPKLIQSSVVLDSPGGQLKCMGHFISYCVKKGKVYNFRVFVVKNEIDNLLSRSAAVDMCLIARLDTVVHPEERIDVFGELGLMKDTKVKIKLKEGAAPYCSNVARRVPIPQLQKVQDELKRMERLNVITPVTDPTDWCSNMVVVPKPGSKVRICVDLKPLNKAVKRELYTLPTVDDILHKLNGATVFSKLDASSGYWQLALDDESSQLTTFITPMGRFRFLRLPFGISSASEIFQREMSRLLDGLSGTAVFQDDVIVFGENEDEHDRNLTRVLARISEANVKLNKEKCCFRQSSIEFLGHLVSKDGVRPHPSKIQAIQELSPPKDVKELRTVMGMLNYLGRHVPDMALIARPLNDLLRKDVTW